MNTCVSRLGYVGVEMSDLQAWRQFATQVLGFEEGGSTEDGGRFFRMDDKHHRLAVHPGSRDDLAYVGWELDDEVALVALAERLAARGHGVTWATEPEANERKVARLLRVSDPNGVVNEVYWRLQTSASPFTPSRALGGFVTGDLGMGHIVLCVDDYEASMRFYCDDLGLEISDTIDLNFGPEAGVRRVAFLHAGARHHALALVPIAAPKRLHHIMVQLASLTDVGTAFDRCQDAGVGIAMSLGEHTNDRMTSFYLRSPSGFQIEYGHGGVEIGDDWQVGHYDAPSLWGHRPVA